MSDTEEPTGPPPLFVVFNEIAIIAQLSGALMNRVLPEGLHNAHFGVLSHLTKREHQTPQALASAFQVTKATMTHTVKVLGARGLVDIAPNPADGRSKLVSITPEGRRLQTRSVAALMPALDALSRDVPAETVDTLRPRLAELRTLLDARRDLGDLVASEDDEPG